MDIVKTYYGRTCWILDIEDINAPPVYQICKPSPYNYILSEIALGAFIREFTNLSRIHATRDVEYQERAPVTDICMVSRNNYCCSTLSSQANSSYLHGVGTIFHRHNPEAMREVQNVRRIVRNNKFFSKSCNASSYSDHCGT